MNGTGNYFTVIAIIVLAAKKQVTYDVITRDNGGRAPLNKQFGVWHELWTGWSWEFSSSFGEQFHGVAVHFLVTSNGDCRRNPGANSRDLRGHLWS